METISRVETAGELYPGRFLKGDDMSRTKPVVLVISDVYREALEDESGEKKTKAVVAFDGEPRQWVACKTNVLCLAAMFGTSLRGWVGRRVALHQDTWKGKPCIRVWGSPDIAEDMPVTIKLPKRKPDHRVMRAMQPKPRAVPQDDAPTPSADDCRASVRAVLREVGADMAGFLEFVEAKVGKSPGPPDTWDLKTAQYLARMVRNGWAADLRTYLAPPMSDNGNPFDGDAA